MDPEVLELHVPVRHNGNVTVLKGPKGCYCSAFPDANGLAYAGGCQSKGGGGCVAKNNYGQSYPKGRGCTIRGASRPSAGTGTSPTAGWCSPTTPRASCISSRLRRGHEPLFRYLNGTYQLQVLNTSGIGYLDGFTWRRPPAGRSQAIKSSSGAGCSVTKAGTIHCAGRVQPPSCLCTGDGGVVTVTFTAVPTKKKAGYLFGGARGSSRSRR